jgi:hypothetical protein
MAQKSLSSQISYGFIDESIAARELLSPPAIWICDIAQQAVGHRREGPQQLDAIDSMREKENQAPILAIFHGQNEISLFDVTGVDAPCRAAFQVAAVLSGGANRLRRRQGALIDIQAARFHCSKFPPPKGFGSHFGEDTTADIPFANKNDMLGKPRMILLEEFFLKEIIAQRLNHINSDISDAPFQRLGFERHWKSVHCLFFVSTGPNLRCAAVLRQVQKAQ